MPTYEIFICPDEVMPVSALEANHELLALAIMFTKTASEFTQCPVLVKETIAELSACPVTIKETVAELLACPIKADTNLSMFSVRVLPSPLLW